MDAARLASLNPQLTVFSSGDAAFAPYGRPFELPGIASFAAAAETLIPGDLEANLYVGSLPELEARPECSGFAEPFGHGPFQVGFCAGPNTRLNGMEYHKSPEIVVAVTELALLLGLPEDVDASGGYDGGKAVCLHMPARSAVELHPRVLHFAPCRLSDACFKSVIVLPRGTNEALADEERGGAGAAGEKRLLFMRNKWLIAHPERTPLVQKGAHAGIRGPNVELRYR